MDAQTIEKISEFICGEGDNYPVYRTGSELTRFFQRAGFSNFTHDGSTRKWWTLSVLQQLSINNIYAVILRLIDPKEYNGNKEKVELALDKLNKILVIEGIEVYLDGVKPCLRKITPQFAKKNLDTKPLIPPDFLKLNLESGLCNILAKRWEEIQKCFKGTAYLSTTILMGSFLEGIFLSVVQRFPKEANLASSAPKDKTTGKVKYFAEWSLSDMINVAHECGWIDLDVKSFSHSLRCFRNLIHPYEQMALNTFPDKDTTEIGWNVVQAAVNDLIEKLH